VSELGIYDQQLLSRFDWLREPDPGAGATPALLMVARIERPVEAPRT